jgi:hypothetical protein
MSKISKTSEPLTQEDMKELSVTRKGVRKVFFIVFPVNLFLVFLFFGILWLAILFIVMALVMTLIYQYSENRYKKDTAEGIKYILEGPVQPLITIEGGTVKAEIDRTGQRLRTQVVKGARTEQNDEPFVLGKGQRDPYFYALKMGDTQVLVDRSIFLDFQPSEYARLEITPPGTLIRYAKIG